MKWLWRILGILLIAAGILCYIAYTYLLQSNINPDKDGAIFYVPTGSTFQSVVDTLNDRDIVKNLDAFTTVAAVMKLSDDNIKSGRYQVNENWTNRSLVNVLRSGQQTAVKLIINNVRKVENIAGSIANQLEIDSTTLINHIKSPENLSQIGTDSQNIITYFIPNTYNVWWNSTPEKIMDRMLSEHTKWWATNNREQKIENLGLSKEEAYTLASIVDKESNLNKEKPRIAGVYLNRINRGIPLQADPTVVFASGDYDLRRVLNKHLKIDSPYNTYKYQGLPIGPIYMASISGLNAVINAESHDYLYFCAGPGFGSEHLFAKTLTQHNRNAARFHKWLNSQGIR